MKLTALQRSFTFRLTLLYLLLFSASVALLLSIGWWATVERPLRRAEAQVHAEAAALEDLYAREGRLGLERALARRARRPSVRAPYQAFAAPGGAWIVGQRPKGARPRDDRPQRIELRVLADYDDDIVVERRTLADGAELWVGRDIDDIDDQEGLLQEAAAWGALIAPPLGLAVGLMMSFAVGRRIDAVVRTARSVMGGDLSRRMQVRGSGDDFDHLSATLNLMLDRIEQLIQSVAGVSDQIAHELRTPLTRLRAELDDLSGEAQATSSMRARAAAAVAEADRLQATFDALLRIARLEADSEPAAPMAVDAGTILHDAMELYLPGAEARGVTLEAVVAPGLSVSGDPNLLFQAVCNLLDNAVKYTPPAGAIRIAGARLGGRVVLSVADNGPGVDPAHRDRIVERFYRAPGGHGAAGLGLGLSLAAAVARLHGGGLSFEDAGPGLKASLLLPAMSA